MHPNQRTINEYVDGGFAPHERADVEAHLTACAACRELARDLREIAAAARTLAPTPPPARAWSAIERAIRHRPAAVVTRGPWFARPAVLWPLAAAAVLVLATAVGLRTRTAAPPRAGPMAPDAAVGSGGRSGDLAQSVEAELRQAEEHYEKAIGGLEQITASEKGSLDPQTAATLEKNLSVVDQAISESRAALKTQPNSEPAQASLLDSFRTKLALLQDTVALINEMRKGNEKGAAKIASGLSQKKSGG